MALVIALLLAYMAMPVFNQLSGKRLTLEFSTKPWLLPALVALGLLTGILAGSYPAFFLSSFNPIAVLKGKFSSGKRSTGFRSGLVVFQFFIAITLMIGTAVVYNQLTFIRHKKLGYDKEQVIVLPQTRLLGDKEKIFSQQILSDPRVINVSTSGYLPAGPSDNNNFFVYSGANPAQMIKSIRYDVDDTYIPTLGMQMVAGRNFSADHATDSAGAILNETAVKALGLEKDPLGSTITNSNNHDKRAVYQVLGVVKDFHFRPMHEKIAPLVMVLGNNSGNIIVKAKTKDMTGLLGSLKKLWTPLSPEAPFTYSFMDERLDSAYAAEQKAGLILGIFSGLTIFVACLGLFGLAMFTASQRNKEIGVRKVLGASVTQIVALLSGDFLKLVLIAALFAFPLAWWIMHSWLQDFAYRINLSWLVFVGAGISTLIIALLTISYQAVKAAIANPVKSLRYE